MFSCDVIFGILLGKSERSHVMPTFSQVLFVIACAAAIGAGQIAPDIAQIFMENP